MPFMVSDVKSSTSSHKGSFVNYVTIFLWSSDDESDDDDGEDCGRVELRRILENQFTSHSPHSRWWSSSEVWSGHQLRGKWEDFGRLWLLDYYNSAIGYVHIPHFVRATFNFLKVLDLIKIQNHISCSDHVAKMTNTNCNFKINRDLYSQTILQCNGFRIMMKGTTPRTRMTDLGLGY